MWLQKTLLVSVINSRVDCSILPTASSSGAEAGVGCVRWKQEQGTKPSGFGVSSQCEYQKPCLSLLAARNGSGSQVLEQVLEELGLENKSEEPNTLSLQFQDPCLWLLECHPTRKNAALTIVSAIQVVDAALTTVRGPR